MCVMGSKMTEFLNPRLQPPQCWTYISVSLATLCFALLQSWFLAPLPSPGLLYLSLTLIFLLSDTSFLLSPLCFDSALPSWFTSWGDTGMPQPQPSPHRTHSHVDWWKFTAAGRNSFRSIKNTVNWRIGFGCNRQEIQDPRPRAIVFLKGCCSVTILGRQ